MDFRVDSSVFLGSRDKPVSESTTIFHGGAVYDYLKEPAEVVVFEKDQNRFVLLDSVRRVRAELTTKQVKAFTEQLRQRSDAAASPYLKFLLTPQFEEQLDEDSGDLTLRSQWITYRLALLTTASQAVATQYREFADWYVQLNAMLDPRSRPPFARLLVNAALGRRQTIAREVQVILASEKTLLPKQTTIHSKHQLIPEVAERDLDRIAQTRQFMQIFKPVSFQQYRSREDP
ncbi:MAG: hypothetical protein A2V70_07575 [Planctomycetes bacterium RBG_13_63_9]|nr:MAG: hypothetical protein A2V70_07575 [Planctomycetes bacterium RBG_13_63_9]